MDLPGELWWRVLFSAGWPLGVGDAARTALARIDFQLGTNGGKVTGDARQWQAFFSFAWRAEHYVCFGRRCEAPVSGANGRDGAGCRLALGRLCTLGATVVTPL